MKQFLIRQIFATVLSLNNKIQEQCNGLSVKMTLRQFMLLLSVEHITPGMCSYNSLAKKLSTTKQNVKQIALSLEKKGYILIETNEKDKRAVNITMTPTGLEAAMGYAKASEEYLNMAAEKFSQEELEQMWEMLKRFYAYDGKEMDGFDNH